MAKIPVQQGTQRHAYTPEKITNNKYVHFSLNNSTQFKISHLITY